MNHSFKKPIVMPSPCVSIEHQTIENDYVKYLALKSNSNKISSHGDVPETQTTSGSLTQAIQRARDEIKNSLQTATELSNKSIRVDELESTVNLLIDRIATLEVQVGKLGELSKVGV